ncbi:hypothetical protein HK098_006647 [Nowakowskiella sp. JEL0407]|nr:hypothetical protein HK098_006647 [Nowakowskiella sp. JEL0407]
MSSTAVISTCPSPSSKSSLPALTIPLRNSLSTRRAKVKNNKLTLAVPNLHLRRPSQTPLSALPIDLGVRAPHPLGRQEVIATLSAQDSGYSADFDKYLTGPICILPNLYLGSEHNASNMEMLKSLGIRCILNVAKEVNNPLFRASSPLRKSCSRKFSANSVNIKSPKALSPIKSPSSVSPSHIVKISRTRNEPRGLEPLRIRSSRTPPTSPRRVISNESLDSPTRMFTGLSLRSRTPSPTTYGPKPLHSISGHIGNVSATSLNSTESTLYTPSTASPSASHINRAFVFPVINVNDQHYDQTMSSPTTPTTPTTPLSPNSMVLPVYRKLYWEHDEEILPHLQDAFDYIDEARNNNMPILINCQQGVSRSATLVIAYTMKTLRLRLAQSYAFVKSRSPHICPNMGLMSQLAVFELELFKDD